MAGFLKDVVVARRSDIFHDDDSSDNESVGDTTAARAALEAYMASHLKLDMTIPEPKPKETEEKPEPNEGPTEYTFCLFSSGDNTNKKEEGAGTEAQKVVLLDDEDAAIEGDGGIVNPARPLSYYAPGESTLEQRKRYSQVAISGDEILAMATPENRVWGLEMPWRAKTLVRVSREAMRALLANGVPRGAPVPASAADAINALPHWASGAGSMGLTKTIIADESAGIKKHRRPGKKVRIARRRKEQATRVQKAAEAKQQADKEEHLQEKKKRLNRIKKLRRREKKRNEKSSAGGVDGDGDGNDSDSHGSLKT